MTAVKDPRVRRTRDRLRDALVSLTREKGYAHLRVADLLARADVGGYVAVPGGRRAAARGPVFSRVWVDAMQYGVAEDVLIRFMRAR
jgi:hypothetical protein